MSPEVLESDFPRFVVIPYGYNTVGLSTYVDNLSRTEPTTRVFVRLLLVEVHLLTPLKVEVLSSLCGSGVHRTA